MTKTVLDMCCGSRMFCIEKIGRARLERVLDRAKKYTSKPDEWHRKNLAEECDSEFIEAMASALLAVIDAKPLGNIDPASMREYRGVVCGGSWSPNPKQGEYNQVLPIYTVPPAESVAPIETSQDEWIEHTGGSMPAHLNRSDLVYLKTRAKELSLPFFAGKVRWRHFNNRFDIIAYRLALAAAGDK